MLNLWVHTVVVQMHTSQEVKHINHPISLLHISVMGCLNARFSCAVFIYGRNKHSQLSKGWKTHQREQQRGQRT